jgi:hypothetical protein
MDRSFLDGLASEIACRSPLEQEQVFRELRDRDLSPNEAIYVASCVLHISLSEAKRAIFMSAAWRDQHASWQQLHSSLEDLTWEDGSYRSFRHPDQEGTS